MKNELKMTIKNMPYLRKSIYFLQSLRIPPPKASMEQFSEESDCTRREWADRFILIASTQRSGSTHLAHMLGQTHEMGVPHEYLNKSNFRYWRQRFRSKSFEEIFQENVQRRTTDNGTFSFKAHWSQFKAYKDVINPMTRNIGIEKAIWIGRKDQLSQAISLSIARQTGAYVAGAPMRSEPKYDYTHILRCANEINDQQMCWKSYFETPGAPKSILVLHEDVVGDPSTRETIRQFLGLTKQLSSPPRIQKQANGLNRDWRERFLSEIREEDVWILEAPKWLDAEL